MHHATIIWIYIITSSVAKVVTTISLRWKKVVTIVVIGYNGQKMCRHIFKTLLTVISRVGIKKRPLSLWNQPQRK